MVALSFDCIGIRVERYAAAPTLVFRLRISDTSSTPVHTIALRCQLRIEPGRRRYSPGEAERLHDLFGDVSRWADTLKPIQFAMVSTMVPGFSGATEVDLTVPCTYDLEVSAARYLAGLEEGGAPLLMLFSGTVFVRTDNGFSVEPVPWSAECSVRLPTEVWQEMINLYFPNSGWIRLSRDTLDALARFKTSLALPTWEAAIESLLTPFDDRTEV
jgi:hypothetical protein